MGAEIERALDPVRAARWSKRLLDAAGALERDRARDALRIVRPLVQMAPQIPVGQEIMGLALYRLGQWTEAAAHLEALESLSGSVEQHPALADCYRALRRYARVDELWNQLKAASPPPAVLTEGRIVAAGALADRGELTSAIRLLEQGPIAPKRAVQDHHVRLWFVLGDLYERAGDTPKARDLFARVVAADPDLADAADRLDALGGRRETVTRTVTPPR